MSKNKTVLSGLVYINSSFNNIIITVVDTLGNTVAWSSAGSMGFKGAKRSTPYAGQVTASNVSDVVKKKFGMRAVYAILKGPGPARDSALRAIQSSGLTVMSIRDRTPVPHNGCRPPRVRRV